MSSTNRFTSFAGTGTVATVIAWFILPEVARRTPAEIDEMYVDLQRIFTRSLFLFTVRKLTDTGSTNVFRSGSSRVTSRRFKCVRTRFTTNRMLLWLEAFSQQTGCYCGLEQYSHITHATNTTTILVIYSVSNVSLKHYISSYNNTICSLPRVYNMRAHCCRSRQAE